MIKIAHISTSFTGGAGIAAKRIHLGLLNNNIDSSFVQKDGISNNSIKIYKSTPYYSLIYRIKKKLKCTEDDIYKREFINTPKNYEIVSIPVSPFRIEDHPIVKEADIVHLHWVADFINYPSFFEKIKQPIVWTLHDMNPFQGIFHYEQDKIRNYNTLGGIDKRALELKRKCIHGKEDINIVTPSNWLKNLSSSSMLLSRYEHSLIPYGLNLDQYPKIEREKAKGIINISNNSKTILFVAHGSNIYRKGFDLLIGALKEINKTSYNLISVGGDKIDIGNGINHIHYNRITDLEKLNNIYSAADITILPSREDNLPNVMIESFANGTPVISFENGGMKEHIKTGENGILVDQISTCALSCAISDFINSKYKFNSEDIRNYAINNFNESIEASRYINLYNKILNRQ